MKDKICNFCANTKECNCYEGIMSNPNLEITECGNFVRLVTKKSCFDCIYQDIFESEHEWLSCRCKKTGEITKQSIYINSCDDFECVKTAVYRNEI